MWLLFLDEFGDFAISKNADGSPKEDHPSWRPTCGYGGFAIPAANYRQFCADFAHFRFIGNQTIAFAQHTAKAQSENGKRLTYPEFQAAFRTYYPSLHSKQDEVKGSNLFSGSYMASSKSSSKKRRTVHNLAKRFLATIEKNEGEIFYYGINKQKYLESKRSRPSVRSLHVELCRGVLDTAFKDATNKNTQFKIIFDHHGKDDETKERLNAKQERKDVSAIAKLQTRQEYCQEILLEKRYYTHLKEPMFFMESHWSLGVQAADWVCSCLGKIISYQMSQEQFSSYERFSRVVGERIEDLATQHSFIHRLEKPAPRQLRLDV